MEFLRAGGWSAISTMIFGLLALVVAGLFVRQATPRRLAIVRALSASTVFAALAGVALNFSTVMFKTTGLPELRDAPDFHLIVMQGLGESVVPAVLGGMLLALTWLLIAVGTRRLDDV
jgi:hypothetical protein